MKPWYTQSNWTGRTPPTMEEAFGWSHGYLSPTVYYSNSLSWKIYSIIVALVVIVVAISQFF